MFKKAIAAAVLLSAFNVHAADLSYSNFSVGFGKIEIDSDGESYDGNAVGVGLSVALGNTFYATADLAKADVEDTDQRTTSFGLGAHAPLSDSTDIYAEASYVRVDVEVDEWSFDDNGTALTLGLRSQLTEKFELGGGVTRLDVFDSAENTYFVNGFYAASENVDLGAELSKADDSTGYGVSLRVKF